MARPEICTTYGHTLVANHNCRNCTHCVAAGAIWTRSRFERRRVSKAFSRTRPARRISPRAFSRAPHRGPGRHASPRGDRNAVARDFRFSAQAGVAREFGSYSTLGA
jgi:hypothetical protein